MPLLFSLPNSSERVSHKEHFARKNYYECFANPRDLLFFAIVSQHKSFIFIYFSLLREFSLRISQLLFIDFLLCIYSFSKDCCGIFFIFYFFFFFFFGGETLHLGKTLLLTSPIKLIDVGIVYITIICSYKHENNIGKFSLLSLSKPWRLNKIIL